VKFARLELPAETEEVESRERALGLVDLGPEAPKSRRAEEEDYADELDESASAAGGGDSAETKKEDEEA
jgi:hypothetical protein